MKKNKSPIKLSKCLCDFCISKYTEKAKDRMKCVTRMF